jgi:glutathionylspermidine synthase
LEAERFEGFRRRAIFACRKWDAQVGDVTTVADRPLVIDPAEWEIVRDLAEALARETLEAEAEPLSRPDLQKRLGIPAAIRRVLPGRPFSDRGDVRLIRFDFHYAAEGWRISEANCDVPGGFNEASGLIPLFAESFPGLIALGDPARALARAIANRCGAGGTVALVHATGYSDDRQVMEFLAERLEECGLRAALTGPDGLRWRDGKARLMTERGQEEVAFILRFFPAEWLPNLSRGSAWPEYFRGAGVPACNPGYALLCQSKRFPLAWDALRASLPTWRRLLPETRELRDADWKRDPDWIVKPAWGRVGQGIGWHGFTPAKEWAQIRRESFWSPRAWVAQRRFHCEPLHGSALLPGLGVYTVDGKAVGAYARLSDRPLIDHAARDTAVFTSPARKAVP